MSSIAFGVSGYTSGLVPDISQRQQYNQLITALAKRGVLMPPLATETIFLSEAHSQVMDEVLHYMEESISEIKSS